jgi:hypothetical protein
VKAVNEQRGFVAIEWAAAVAFLLLPVVMLVATLPSWAERRHAATVAAREGARVLADAWPHGDAHAAEVVAREVAADHGIAAGEIDVRVRSLGDTRGSYVRVEVVVTMPAVAVMGMGAGAWHYTAVETRRIDDYRSR